MDRSTDITGGQWAGFWGAVIGAIIGALLIVMTFVTPSHASPSSFQPTADIATLKYYSPTVANAYVRGYGSYSWVASCTGTPDDYFFVSANSGGGSGCWTLINQNVGGFPFSDTTFITPGSVPPTMLTHASGPLDDVVIGNGAGSAITGNAFECTFVGSFAGHAFTNRGAAYPETCQNTFIGANAGIVDVDGAANTFIGQKAGQANVHGDNNVAVGEHSCFACLGNDWVAVGASAGQFSTATSDSFLTAVGFQAGCDIQDPADGVIAIGDFAVAGGPCQPTPIGTPVAGSFLLGIGRQVLWNDTTGTRNTGLNAFALNHDTTGSDNFCGGYQTCFTATTSNNIVAIGSFAGFSQTGSDLILLGREAGDSLPAANGNTMVLGSFSHGIFDIYAGQGFSSTIAQSSSNFSIHGTGGSGANNPGGSIHVVGGAGTGNAIGGPVYIDVTPAGSSGSTANAIAHTCTFNSDLSVVCLGAVTASSFTGTVSLATTATNLAGGATGSIPYQSAAGSTTFLADVATGSVLLSGGVTTAPTWGALPLTAVAAQATNTVLGNATAGSSAPTALAVGSCSTSASALIWTTNTGFGCNTSINAATLGGATFAVPGAIGGTTPGSGAFTTVTATSNISSTHNSGTISITPVTNTTFGFFQVTNGGGQVSFGLDNSTGTTFGTSYAATWSFNGGVGQIISGGTKVMTFGTPLIALPAITTDASNTTAAVCEDTTSHALYFGSVTAACHVASSRRFKTDEKFVPEGLAEIDALRPKTFRYKPQYGDPSVLQFGFIAEDVAEAAPRLASYDSSGRPDSVNVLGLVPVTVNAIQQLHSQTVALSSSFAALVSNDLKQDAAIASLTARVSALETKTDGAPTNAETPPPANDDAGIVLASGGGG